MTSLRLKRLVHRPRLALAALISALALAGCSTPPPPTQAPADATTNKPAVGSGEREVRSLSPRALLAHEHGLTLLDLTTGEVVEQTDHPGFLRLNQAGDGRHLAGHRR